MYRLKVESSFDSAHFLKNHDGACANIHGHRWKVIAVLGKRELIQKGPKEGMILDFSDLKRDLNRLTGEFDHAFVIQKGSLQPATVEALEGEGFRLVFVDFRMTAEQIAKYFFDSLKALGHPVVEVEVYESPKNCAIYQSETD